MTKYSYEFKKKIVEAYLSNEGGYKYLAKKYGVPSKRNVEVWIHDYQAYGDTGLMRSRKNKLFLLNSNFL